MTKKERHEFYKLWIENHINLVNENEYNYVGLCHSLELTNQILNKYHNINSFTEIIKHEPEGNEFAPYWFSHDVEGVMKRIKILQSAIKETAPNKKIPSQKTLDYIYIVCVILVYIILCLVTNRCNGQTVKEVNHMNGKSIVLIQFPEYKNFWGVWQLKGLCSNGNEIFRNGSPLNLNSGFDLFPCMADKEDC